MGSISRAHPANGLNIGDATDITKVTDELDLIIGAGVNDNFDREGVATPYAGTEANISITENATRLDEHKVLIDANTASIVAAAVLTSIEYSSLLTVPLTATTKDILILSGVSGYQTVQLDAPTAIGLALGTSFRIMCLNPAGALVLATTMSDFLVWHDSANSYGIALLPGQHLDITLVAQSEGSEKWMVNIGKWDGLDVPITTELVYTITGRESSLVLASASGAATILAINLPTITAPLFNYGFKVKNAGFNRPDRLAVTAASGDALLYSATATVPTSGRVILGETVTYIIPFTVPCIEFNVVATPADTGPHSWVMSYGNLGLAFSVI